MNPRVPLQIDESFTIGAENLTNLWVIHRCKAWMMVRSFDYNLMGADGSH